LNPIGVGIVGAGNWGRKVAAGYLDAERRGRVKLVKVCDNSVASLGALLIEHETASIEESRLSVDIRDIMESAEISAVHVATPSATHSALVRTALEAGKNVLVETPISLNSLECNELIGIAAKKGLIIEDCNYGRFNRAVQAATEMVRKGDLGSILYVGIQWADAAHVIGRDILFELGPSPIGILNLLLGTCPKELSGVAGAYRKFTHNEIINIFAQYPDEIFAHIELNGLHPRQIGEVFIVGSLATLDVDCSNQRIVEYSASKITEVPVLPSDTIADEIDHFVDRITHGDPVDSAMTQTVETLEAIQSCLWTKVPSINQFDRAKRVNESEMPNLETAVGLLEIVHKGANKTPIENEGELNPDLVRRYFMMLEKIGLVESWDRANEEKTYSLTTKGLQFLVDYYESQRLGEITDNTRRILQAVGLGRI